MSDNVSNNKNNQVHDIFGRCITSHLEQSGAVPEKLEALVNNAVITLMGSDMIIEDNFTPMTPLQQPRISQPLESFAQTEFIDELTDKVKHEGFGPHFHQIIGLFGSIMLGLCATEDQQALVNKWLEQGHFGNFLMTDGGGPTLAYWNTTLTPIDDGNFTLNVDKKWGIEGQNVGFGMVVCQQKGKPFPVTVLLSPEKSQTLQQQACGGTFLDGRLQLGNVKGQVQVSKEDFFTKGGLGSVNRFLTLVRPRFVKSLMHHLLWLQQQDRLTLEQDDLSAIDFIINMANWCTAKDTFSIHSVDQVLALKFTSNELLLSLVRKGALKHLNDQRDLLGFTKMEGSSYRCLFEVYSKFKRGRV
ncbi:hypothetical protein [Thalassomonas actiniarum]|uniref:Acyl-CoA dehydrogenase n=1 Tax=Thalassomonas actiniarum TaxID=485447 RepID=A0AAF0C6P6_9GAMM|nr:hypothetical protein [Thalassomonas actiniarum]WDE02325.1 hypothetical protein SG35_031740 [Thalassomonas actiniarum]